MTTSSVRRIRHIQRGFTLVEILLVGAILTVLALFTTQLYRNYARSIEFQGFGDSLLSDMVLARSNAMSGLKGKEKKWGLHLVNGANDYYEVFSTAQNYGHATTEIITTVDLPTGMAFTDPSEGMSKDVLFNDQTWTTTAASVSITFEGQTRSITVKSIGNVY